VIKRQIQETFRSIQVDEVCPRSKHARCWRPIRDGHLGKAKHMRLPFSFHQTASRLEQRPLDRGIDIVLGLTIFAEQWKKGQRTRDEIVAGSLNDSCPCGKRA
jgi:hypothetical protein